MYDGPLGMCRAMCRRGSGSNFHRRMVETCFSTNLSRKCDFAIFFYKPTFLILATLNLLMVNQKEFFFLVLFSSASNMFAKLARSTVGISHQVLLRNTWCTCLSSSCFGSDVFSIMFVAAKSGSERTPCTASVLSINAASATSGPSHPSGASANLFIKVMPTILDRPRCRLSMFTPRSPRLRHLPLVCLLFSVAFTIIFACASPARLSFPRVNPTPTVG